MSDISGRLALITGGSRGIGREIALALAEAGANVIVIYQKEQKKAEEVVSEIQKKGRIAWAFSSDLADANQIQALSKTISSECRIVISILVNNAGISKKIPLEKISINDWNATIAANLTSAFLMTQMVTPAMRKQGFGRIINISSIAAQTGGVIGPHYAASKAGLIGLTHSYASLLAKDGITVNAISPAIIDTDMLEELKELQDKEKEKDKYGRDVVRIKPSMIPVGRFGESKEVASMVVELANNGYITGQTININGGWYMQ